jgi:hypothetical protein
MAMRATVLFILNEGLGEAIDYSFSIIEWGLNQGVVSPEQALNFVDGNIDAVASKYEIQAMSSLLQAIPDDIHSDGQVAESAREHVIELLSSNFTEFIDVDWAFSNVEYGDDRAASNELEKLVDRELLDLGIDYSSADVVRILDSFDVAGELQSYFENTCRDEDRDSAGPATLAIDEIDDLFDRG